MPIANGLREVGEDFTDRGNEAMILGGGLAISGLALEATGVGVPVGGALHTATVAVSGAGVAAYAFGGVSTLLGHAVGTTATGADFDQVVKVATSGWIGSIGTGLDQPGTETIDQVIGDLSSRGFNVELPNRYGC